MGRRGVLALALVGVVAAGCATTVDGSRAAPAPASPITITQLTTDPCAALYPDQVRALGFIGPGTTVTDPYRAPICRWTTSTVSASLLVYPRTALGGLRSYSPAPYVDTTLAGRPALAWRPPGGCWAASEAGGGVLLIITDNAGTQEGETCPVAVRTVEQAVDIVSGRLTPAATQDLDVLANSPCSAGARMPLASIVGRGAEQEQRPLDTGDLSCRWVGDDGGLTFVAVAGASPDAPPGSLPTHVGDRAAAEVHRATSCSVAVFSDGRSLQITVVAPATAPRPDCESAHLAMQSLLGA